MPNPVTHCFCLLAGAYALGFLDRLPPEPVPAWVLLSAAALYRFPVLRGVAVFAIGAAIMALAASAALEDRLSEDLVGQEILLIARVEDFPVRRGESTSFLVRPVNRVDLPATIRLSWYGALEVPNIGECWHLRVRLRRPRGSVNPGGFDFEGWLFRERIGATGYVVAQRHNYRILGSPVGVVDRLRQHIVDRLGDLLPAGEATAALQAVAAGARQDIQRAQWEQYAATGTSHLMAISGLHIGLAAGCAFFLGWAAAALLPGRHNIRDIAVVGAMLVAATYAALSGFAVPARRALLMAVFTSAALLRRRRLEPAAIMANSAIVIFLANPLAILSPGFQLSFAAVAVLLVVRETRIGDGPATAATGIGRLRAGVRRLWALQLGLLAGLFPLTVLLFNRFSLAAPIVNMLVLPVFNLVTVPLALAGLALDGILAPLGDQLLWAAMRSIRVVLAVIRTAAGAEFLSYRSAAIATPVMLLPLLYVVLPPGWPGRRLAIVAVICALSYRPPPPPPDCLRFDALDVGQGLAVVLRTHAHTLLFDTGPAFRSGSDAADSVILPFLRSAGIDRLDLLVVSHADLDHAGGVLSILQQIPVAAVMAGESLDAYGLTSGRCSAGLHWAWDGVRFRVLHPGAASRWSGNNDSCVIDAGIDAYRVLLPGDIESPVEKLLAHRGALQPMHAVFVPHHGSRTSSGEALVRATRPALAIVSAGFRNRWGLPREDVVRRWQQAGARVLNTADSGAISQQLCRGDGAGPLSEMRIESARYWHDSRPAEP